jgi:hypothetical protein
MDTIQCPWLLAAKKARAALTVSVYNYQVRPLVEVEQRATHSIASTHFS